MTQQYYTLEEANTHWKHTIEQGKKILEKKIQQDILTTARYETASVTR